MARRKKAAPRKAAPPRRPEPVTDSDPFLPVYDTRPEERTGRQVREAIEADALLERRGETGR